MQEALGGKRQYRGLVWAIRLAVVAVGAATLPPIVAIILGALILLTAWTPPPTFSPLDIITAAILNTYWRDNLLHLKEQSVAAGSMMWWPTNSAPTGWLVCDGGAVSRTTYAGLFAIIGTTFGPGDGTTTFNLPDFRGRSPIGALAGTFDLGDVGGAETVTLTEANLPSHTHTMPSHTHGVGYVATSIASGGSEVPSLNLGGGGFSVNTDSGTGGDTGATGSGTAVSIRNPYRALTAVIRT